LPKIKFEFTAKEICLQQVFMIKYNAKLKQNEHEDMQKEIIKQKRKR